MADEENCAPRLTRAAATKSAAASAADKENWAPRLTRAAARKTAADEENSAPRITRAAATKSAAASEADKENWAPRLTRAAARKTTADEENSAPRITRAAAKRAATAADLEPIDRTPNRRKRVALGDLPTLCNAVPSASDADFCTPPLPPRWKRGRKEETRKGDRAEIAASANGASEVYALDIYQHLRSMELEAKRRPLANYMASVQRDVTANMRGILVDWLVDVAEEYKLVSDTLYLTVSYIDRFLSINAINKERLQLLGVSAMLIASKCEEITPPNVEDFCYISDNTYTKKEVVKMETDILKVLNFEMSSPTIKTFLSFDGLLMLSSLNLMQNSSMVLDFLGSYLAELSLLDYGCVQFLPSVIAASAIYLARFTMDPSTHPWSKKLKQYTDYSVVDLRDCVRALHDLQLKRKASHFTAISEKYKQQMFQYVSELVPPVDIPSIYFDEPKELPCGNTHYRQSGNVDSPMRGGWCLEFVEES
ncbi:hypothetical protein Cni_G06206 [Canna indica]|uniref:Cyclin N-terminal domain-containing protein n=1 Tax=Canna indica TaxID=4628 RepID=A0AAQ3JY33_9LILI|nr:hypothetical protein Cni_G06206 [Canna indica]